MSGSSSPPVIKVQRTKTNSYAVMFISPAKPPERATHDKDSYADAPNRKHSHYCNRHSINFDDTEGLQRLPQRPPKEEIQHAREQEEREKRRRQHTKKFW